LSRLKTGLTFGAILVVVMAGGQGLTAAGASAPVPAPRPGKAQHLAVERAAAASAGRVLGLASGEALVVKDVVADADGSTHVRYDRTYNGLRVVGGDLVSHRDRSGKVKGVNWNGARKVAVASTKPALSLASARAAGLRKASLARVAPASTKAELVVYSGGTVGTSAKASARLAFDVLTVGVRADQTPSRLHTIVDARTGAALVSFDEIQTGTGHGIYGGPGVSIGTTAGPPWSMRDAAGNVTTDLNGGNDMPAPVPGTTFTDADNNWGDGTVSDRASAGVDAHYGAERTFDFYKNVLGRNGIWNTGAGARSRVHFGDSFDNAFWDGTQMTYGDGAGNLKPLVELDIAGHEMTHGVTDNTAGLVYVGEAGGLNEATSDIFGTSVEWHANNSADTPDYLIGELVDLNGNGTPLRYMDRPSRDGVSRDCWSPTVGNLDPHFSSGPLNHWFYLASEGSGAKVINGVSYDSPTCNASTVAPIGREQAAKIWYRTLSTYLTSGSGFAAARDGAIQSAKDLYPTTPTVCAGIAASFSAIGVVPGAATCGTPAPRPSGNNLLNNPGFESGDTLWSASPDVLSQWGSLAPARSGTWNAWLGGLAETHMDSISQLVTIPAGSSAALSYYVSIDTFEPPTSARDTMKIRAGTTVLQTLSNLHAANGYQLKTVDLSAYAGRTVMLSVSGTEDGVAATSFILDDLAVTAWNATASTVIFSPLDFTGDAKPDVMRVSPSGDLYLYRGNGLGGFSSPGTRIGGGWGGFAKVFSPGDFTGDGKADVLAVKTNGDLYLYRGNGLGAFSGSGVKIGTGWAGSAKLLSPGDFTGDGRADLVAVRTNGDLFVYRGSGTGGFTGPATRIGTGWGIFKTVFSPRDFTGDGRSDLVAVTTSGDLFLYRGNGAGGFSGSATRIGTGWNIFTTVFSPRDFTGDRKSDFVAVKANGFLYLYRGNGIGGFSAGTRVIPGLF